MRTPISKGAVIPLNGREYHIDDVIGEGASCIVYDVSVRNPSGITYRYRLKECCPYNAQYRRAGNQIVWEDEAQKQAAFDRFTKAAQVIADLRSQESLGNDITETELCEGNGTLYAVMSVNHAKTYSFDDSKDLHRILQTMLKLTRIVGRLHEQGYLHLDIKPDNFLVHYDPDPNIWLFDVDSLVPIADLQSGRTTCYSYSKEWAAPELSQGKLSKVCPATDLFSIGAILFSKVMGRSVFNDDMGLFADWEFDGEIFDIVNPKVQRYLREIFKKTLSVSVKRRYQDASELASILTQALSAVGRPFFVSNCPPVTNQFIGREIEIQQIRHTFMAGNRAIFLHGEGGIGKSSLAIAYANKHQREYDAILFLRYKDSLEHLLEDVELQNYEQVDGSPKKILRKLMDQHVLLIIDNFDVEIDQDDYLEELLTFKAHILFTTRTNFSCVLSGRTVQIEINALPNTELVRLFCIASGIHTIDTRESQIHQLFKFVGNNTYATELLGLQVASSGCSIEELIQKLQNGINGLGSSEKVRTYKDGRIMKQRLPDVIRILFQIADLSEERKRTLRNLYLLRFLNIDHATYRWFSYEFSLGVDILNDLVEIGWVRFDGRFFTLHPLVEELVKTDLKPCEENCIGVYHIVNQYIQKTIEFTGYDDAAEYEFENNCQFVCSFLSCLDFSVSENRRKAINWLLGLIENEIGIGLPGEYYFTKLYKKLLYEVDAHHTSAKETFDVRYILVIAWSEEFYSFRVGESVEERRLREDTRLREFKKVFEFAKTAASNLPAQQQETALDLLYAAVPLRFSAIMSGLPKDYLLQLYDERPTAFSYSIQDRDWLGIPVPNEERKDSNHGREKTASFSSSHEGQPDESAWGKKIDAIINGIGTAESPISVAKNILINGQTPIYQAVALLIYYCDSAINKIICSRSLSETHEYIRTTNWIDLEGIIDLVVSARSSPEWCNEYDGYDLDEDAFFTRVDNGRPFISSIHALQIHRAIIAAITSNHTLFCKLMEGDLGPADNRRTTASEIFGILWDDLALACKNIGKCSYVVPYLVHYMDELDIDPGDYPGERDYIKNYVMIKELAEIACKGATPDDGMFDEFCKIAANMTTIIDRITEKKYSLRAEIESLNGSVPESSTKVEIESSIETLYKQRFYEAQDKVAFIRRILNNQSLSDFEKATRIAHCTDGVFMPFHMELHHPNRNYDLDWKQFEDLLDIEEEHLISDTWKCKNRDEHEQWDYFITCNTVNQAIVYAATDNVDMFEQCIELIFSDLKGKIAWHLNNGEHWTHFLSLKGFQNAPVNYVVSGLSHIKKQSWIVDHLIRFERGWKEYARNKGYTDEEAFFSLYKSIAECAEAADLEKNVPLKYQQDFFDIFMSYQDRMDKIAGARYTLRLEND